MERTAHIEEEIFGASSKAAERRRNIVHHRMHVTAKRFLFEQLSCVTILIGVRRSRSSSVGCDLHRQNGNVIPRVGITGPGIDLVQNCFDAFLQGFVSVLFDDFLQAFDTKLGAVAVHGFGDAVGAEVDAVAGLETNRMPCTTARHWAVATRAIS